MTLYHSEIVLVQFLLNHRKKPSKALRFKVCGLFVCNVLQPLEQVNGHCQQVSRTAQDSVGIRMAAPDAQPVPALPLHEF